MIQPPPRKVKCKKCGYSMIKQPKSDCLRLEDMMNKCPKCGGSMVKAQPNIIDDILQVLKGKSPLKRF